MSMTSTKGTSTTVKKLHLGQLCTCGNDCTTGTSRHSEDEQSWRHLDTTLGCWELVTVGPGSVYRLGVELDLQNLDRPPLRPLLPASARSSAQLHREASLLPSTPAAPATPPRPTRRHHSLTQVSTRRVRAHGLRLPSEAQPMSVRRCTCRRRHTPVRADPCGAPGTACRPASLDVLLRLRLRLRLHPSSSSSSTMEPA